MLKSLAAIRFASSRVRVTDSISGTVTTRLPCVPTSGGTVSGVAASTSRAAVCPTIELIDRSNALGVPPRCTCPRMVTRVSSPSRSSSSRRT